eukprot:4889098-Prymnesium_polylepis.1
MAITAVTRTSSSSHRHCALFVAALTRLDTSMKSMAMQKTNTCIARASGETREAEQGEARRRRRHTVRPI